MKAIRNPKERMLIDEMAGHLAEAEERQVNKFSLTWEDIAEACLEYLRDKKLLKENQ